MRQTGFINHELLRLSNILCYAQRMVSFHCRYSPSVLLLPALLSVSAHYTPHQSLLTSENKGMNQSALLLSKDVLAHPLSFQINNLPVKHFTL